MRCQRVDLFVDFGKSEIDDSPKRLIRRKHKKFIKAKVQREKSSEGRTLKSISHRHMSTTMKKRKHSRKRKKKASKKSDWYNGLMKKLDSQIKDLKKLIKK